MDRNLDVTARQRSRAVWDAMAAGWEATRDDLWADSHAVGEWLVQELDPKVGDVVLELAAGVGDTGLLAAERVGGTGRVLITDFAPEMVAAARRRARERGADNVEFMVVDAEKIDLPSRSVDGVLCRWGYMLTTDPTAAFAETRRVLKPDGRLALSVWGPADRNPWASIVGAILVRRGSMPPPNPGAPGIFALADASRLKSLVMGAGFHTPKIVEFPTRRRFADFAAYWRYLTELAGAISPVLRGLSDSDRAEVQEELRVSIARYAAGEGYELPGLCLNAATW